MYASYDQIHRAPGNAISIPLIWVAIVLSLLVHLAAMWEFLPKLNPLSLAGPDKQGISPLAVRLAAPPGPRTPPAPVAEAPLASPPQVPTMRAPPIRPPRPSPLPQIAVPAPSAPAMVIPRAVPPILAAPTPPMPAPAPRAIEGDLSAYIASRRRERGDSTPSGSQGLSPEARQAEDDRARRDRAVNENMAGIRTPTFGGEPRNGGGVFQLQRVGPEEATFTFFGWNTDIRRKLNQRIDVPRGDNPDIRIAVVRKIITIIREQEKGEFRWQSLRLGRDLNLSARPEDAAELEAFMMLEFFTSSSAPR